jgi:hypothetical protein
MHSSVTVGYIAPIIKVCKGRLLEASLRPPHFPLPLDKITRILYNYIITQSVCKTAVFGQTPLRKEEI